MINKTKLSIITVTFNRKEDLAKTIESVRFNKNIGKDIEYIIVDGISKDGSIELIENNKDIVDIFVSEKDNGLYDAMNKGARLASGSHLLFLNAGDLLLYLDDNLPSYTSTSFYFNSINNKVERNPFTKKYLARNTVCHQSLFYKKDEFVEYDLSHPVIADYEQMTKVIKSNTTVFNNSIIFFDKPTLSSTSNKILEIFKRYKIRFSLVYKNLGLVYTFITFASFIKSIVFSLYKRD